MSTPARSTNVPLGPFYSRSFTHQGVREAYFLVSLLDEQDRPCWAMIPNVRGCGFVFTSREGLHAWLKVNGFLDSANSVHAARNHAARNMDNGGLLDD
jgi:hypothetical protein